MPKDDQTWANVCYVFFGIVAAYIGWNAVNTLGIQTGWGERYDSWYPLLTTFSSVVIGIISVLLVRRKPESREYHLAAISELRKVTWPTWDDTKKMTLIVVVVVAIFGAVLTVFDMVWSWALKQILA